MLLSLPQHRHTPDDPSGSTPARAQYQSYGSRVTAECRADGSWDRTELHGAHRCAGERQRGRSAHLQQWPASARPNTTGGKAPVIGALSSQLRLRRWIRSLAVITAGRPVINRAVVLLLRAIGRLTQVSPKRNRAGEVTLPFPAGGCPGHSAVQCAGSVVSCLPGNELVASSIRMIAPDKAAA